MSFCISYPDLKKLPHFQTSFKEGIGGEKRPKERVKTG
jgi:hypothetical protein